MIYVLRSKAETASHVVASVVLLLASVVLAYSLVINIINIKDGMTFFLALVVAIFTVSVWCITVFSILKTLTYPFADQDGIGLKRFGKVKTYIKWKQIKSRGKGVAPTLRGPISCRYFAKVKLTDEQLASLDVLRNDVVSFAYLPPNLPDEIAKRLTL